MKVGDLVSFSQKHHDDVFDPAVGVVVQWRSFWDGPSPRATACWGVVWNFDPGQVGWQKECELEVISESR